ncbi:retrotransposon nucleocapsid protein [Gigaspora margarita]|uniref:Retrotransposon nucleocapsid protein n=1 Tax=Gigaspora margarita TaxID=4874 RepID=A0A8H3XCH4_GIGMA|nr:retrotransposon nucleocapsid protein [Gigaspora margarita]
MRNYSNSQDSLSPSPNMLGSLSPLPSNMMSLLPPNMMDSLSPPPPPNMIDSPSLPPSNMIESSSSLSPPNVMKSSSSSSPPNIMKSSSSSPPNNMSLSPPRPNMMSLSPPHPNMMIQGSSPPPNMIKNMANFAAATAHCDKEYGLTIAVAIQYHRKYGRYEYKLVSPPLPSNENMVSSLLSPNENVVPQLLSSNENVISPLPLPPNVISNVVSLLLLQPPPNVVNMVSQPPPSAIKNMANSRPFPSFYATQNVIEAEAINYLEVYTEKLRAQIEKGRKHPRRFEQNDLVQIRISKVDHAGCQYGRLNEHYTAIELVPINGTFREYPELIVIPETCVSAHEAAIQQSSGSITATKCLCKGNCLKNYCKYKKAGATCSNRCHPNNIQCKNN